MTFVIGPLMLDMCVLSILSKEDAYGYSLTQNIKEIINVSETTLYPVLRRLQKDEYLIAYNEAFGGRNRRYYQITELGKKRMEEYKKEWNDYKAKVDELLVGGIQNEQA